MVLAGSRLGGVLLSRELVICDALLLALEHRAIAGTDVYGIAGSLVCRSYR